MEGFGRSHGPGDAWVTFSLSGRLTLGRGSAFWQPTGVWNA